MVALPSLGVVNQYNQIAATGIQRSRHPYHYQRLNSHHPSCQELLGIPSQRSVGLDQRAWLVRAPVEIRLTHYRKLVHVDKFSVVGAVFRAELAGRCGVRVASLTVNSAKNCISGPD